MCWRAAQGRSRWSASSHASRKIRSYGPPPRAKWGCTFCQTPAFLRQRAVSKREMLPTNCHFGGYIRHTHTYFQYFLTIYNNGHGNIIGIGIRYHGDTLPTNSGNAPGSLRTFQLLAKHRHPTGSMQGGSTFPPNFPKHDLQEQKTIEPQGGC